jgi:peptidyl-prolyl cis-trans isomerase B (cyclophilin B)
VPTNKQRREAARRHLERQLERREVQAKQRKQRNLIITVVGTIVVVAVLAVVGVMTLSSGNGKKASAAATPSTSTTATPSAAATPVVETNGACHYVKAGIATRNVGLPPDPAKTPTTTHTLAVTTNLGALTLQLDGAAAPCNVQSIAYLATKGFYNNTPCPRVTTTGIFVLQCGDPAGNGSGDPGYQTKDENLAAANYSAVGTIAMANGGPNTNGSQFFIIYKNTSSLPKSYTVIGKVTSGMNIVQKVATAGSDNSNPAGGGKPKLPITFTKVTATPPVTGVAALTTVTPSVAASQ